MMHEIVRTLKEVYQFLALGGPIMVPIFLGSIVALAIFLERLWSLKAEEILPKNLKDTLPELVKKGDFETAIKLCKKDQSPLAKLYSSLIEYRKLPRGELIYTIEEKGKELVSEMEKYIEAIGTIASISPLLGLLGTVTGMIQVFREIVALASEGTVDPTRLANGIWEALLTTAAGLSVAIPAYIGYKYLLSKVNRYSLELENEAQKIVDILTLNLNNKDSSISKED